MDRIKLHRLTGGLSVLLVLSACAEGMTVRTASTVNLPGGVGHCVALSNNTASFSANGAGQLSRAVVPWDTPELYIKGLKGVRRLAAPPGAKAPDQSEMSLDEAVKFLFGNVKSNSAKQPLAPDAKFTYETVLASDEDYFIGWDRQHYVSQSNPNLCWAAVLAMAFRHFGLNYAEDRFVAANRRICSGMVGSRATLNQIMYALTAVHLGNGTWISDANGEGRAWADKQLEAQITQAVGNFAGLPSNPGMVQPPPFPTFFDGVQWTTIFNDGFKAEGGAFPRSDTSELLLAMVRRNPVIVGIKQGQDMHVYLLVGIRARPGGRVDMITGDIIPEPGQTKIETVSLVDPATSADPELMLGDAFIKSARFAIEIAQPRHP